MTVEYNKKHNLSDVIMNDSVNSLEISMTDTQGDAIDLTTATFTMTFVDKRNIVYRTLTLGNGLSTSGNVLTVSIQPFTNHGTFKYDLEMVKDGVKRTYLQGEIVVHNEITQG